MADVVFVAPYFLPTTARFIDAVARTPGVRLGLISHDPAEKLGPEVKNRLTSHLKVDNALDTAHLVAAVAAIGREMGGVDRLMGPLEELQVPLAVVREQLGIPGIDVETARNFRDKDRMKSVMARNGLPCAQHRLVGSADDARRFISEIGLPVVAKPPAGSG
ncbi:MAG: ATP-grasp domain-containing protein, partial [Acidimicrobiia bacterium]